MKILITSPSLNPLQNVSGISTVVQTIMQYNNEHKYFHYILGSPDKKQNNLIWIFKSIKQLFIFPFALKRYNIQLVHQNLPLNPKGVSREYIINLWCRLFKIPVILHVHGGIFLMNGIKNKYYKQITKSLFNHSCKVLILSELENDSLKQNYNFKSAQVLCNSINVANYENDGKRLSKNKPNILFLGRIHESKGIDDIIDALRLLKEKISFRFIICGTGPATTHFTNECEQLLGSDFEYLGIVYGSTKTIIIKKADFFILPSRYGEGLPMSLLETMAAGVVPIVTDDASMKYVVQHNYNGIRVEKRNSNDIYEKLLLILKNPNLYESLSKNAVKTIKEQFDINIYIKKLNIIYSSAFEFIQK